MDEVVGVLSDVAVPVLGVRDEEDLEAREAVAQRGEDATAGGEVHGVHADDDDLGREVAELVVEVRRHAQVDEPDAVSGDERGRQVELPHRLDEGETRQVGPAREREMQQKDLHRRRAPCSKDPRLAQGPRPDNRGTSR